MFNIPNIPNDRAEFDELNLTISKSEYENRRPNGRAVEINRPHWIGRFKFLCELLQEHHDQGRISEIGSYRYNLTTILEMKGFDVVGVDKNVDKMSEYIRTEGLDIRECDIEKEELPFEDRSVSTVLFTEVFEHLRVNPFFPLREIERILKKDGKVIISTPNLHYIGNRVSLLLGNGVRTMYNGYEEFKQLEKEGFPGHIRVYSVDELKRFLEDVGLNTQEVLFRGFPHGKKDKFLYPFCLLRPNLRKRTYMIAEPETGAKIR